MQRRPRILDIPDVKGLAEARESLSAMVEEVQDGEAYVIRSPRGKALLVGLDEFKELQESYLDLEGRLEAVRMLEDEGIRESLEASFEDDEEEPLTLSQVKVRYTAELESLENESLENDGENIPAALAIALAKYQGTGEPITEEVLARITQEVVRAASSAAGTAAARVAASRAASSTVGTDAAEATEEAADRAAESEAADEATKAAEAAAGEAAERVLLSS